MPATIKSNSKRELEKKTFQNFKKSYITYLNQSRIAKIGVTLAIILMMILGVLVVTQNFQKEAEQARAGLYVGQK